MAHIVNTDTTLGRRVAVQRVWLLVLIALGLALLFNLGRGIGAELGGAQGIREHGLAAAASGACHRVFGFVKGSAPSPYATRRLAFLGAHIVGLVVVGQLVWLPLMVLRRYRGQQRVLRELELLPHEYCVLNDVRIPGPQTPAQMDHVVVSPYGLWCIETKPHTGCVAGGEYDYEWVQVTRARGERRGGHRFYNPVRENATHCARLSDHLNQERLEAPVRSMVVFPLAELDANTLTPVERADTMIETMLRLDEERVLEAEQVGRIVAKLATMLAARTSAKARVATPAAVMPASESRSA